MTLIYNRHEMRERRRELRKRMTTAEVLLWSRLRSKQVDGLRFRRQASIGSYVVDFYLPSHHLAIELDGSSHDQPEIKEYDSDRQEWIESVFIHFLRFQNEEVFHELDNVLLKISQKAKKLEAAKENRRNGGTP